MTDKRQSDALRLADELEDSLESHDGSSLTARCQGIADDAAAELRSQYAELETLRAGYAAARLDIESLRAAQPGAAYATRPDEREAFEAMMRSQTFDSLKRLSDGSYESYEARVGWLAWNVRAAHGQAPAQAVPAAVAGPSGYGPNVTVRRSCSDCKACNSESYAVQGDSGHYVYCEHPSLPESKYIGDTNWNTPHWCPVSAPTTQPAPQQEAQEPCPSCRNSDIYACTCTFPKSRNTAPQPSPAAQGDAELGRTAMRFVDRAGDVHPGIDDAETICAEFYKAMSDVIEKMPHVQRMQPSMSAPASQEGKSHDN